YAHSHSPLASFGSQRSFCSSLPASLIPSEPSSCTARIRPLVAQTFETSSIATNVISALDPAPPYSSSNMSPKSSCSRKSSTTSQGNSALMSISAARGAIRSRESARIRSRISRCSSLSTSWDTFAIVGTRGLNQGGPAADNGKHCGLQPSPPLGPVTGGGDRAAAGRRRLLAGVLEGRLVAADAAVFETERPGVHLERLGDDLASRPFVPGNHAGHRLQPRVRRR